MYPRIQIFEVNLDMKNFQRWMACKDINEIVGQFTVRIDL